MRRFRVYSLAKLDILEIVDYLKSRSPKAALRFIEAVDATIARIRAMPRTGGPLLRPDRQEQDWRSVRVLGFKNYIVYYRIDPDLVHVVRLAHASRDLESLLQSG